MSEPVELAGYDPVAKLLHWAIVLLLAVQYPVAWLMPEIHRGTQPETLISLHLTLGTAILLIMLVRLGWRLSHPVPAPSAITPAWQVALARATHLLLYVLLIVAPVLGWANASTRGWDVTLFGVVPLPALLPAHVPYGPKIGDVHTLLAYVMLGLLALHVAAALYHHFRLGDRTLHRMLR